MIQTHNLGFPRIGEQRSLKIALEQYWKGSISAQNLQRTAASLRKRHWKIQDRAGIDYIPVGDFSLYDHVLDTSLMLGVIPERFGWQGGEVNLDTYFRMARGRAPTGLDTSACEMTKWFDTNYHYIVPEFSKEQSFKLTSHKLFDEVSEAQSMGYQVKPVIIGPLSYLWLGKAKGEGFDKLDLLEGLIPVYREILNKLQSQGVEWVQFDEPVLTIDIGTQWRDAFAYCYKQLAAQSPKVLLTTYFGELRDNLELACTLPVHGLHLDLIRAKSELHNIIDLLPETHVLSVGCVDGRNIWRTDLDQVLAVLQPLKEKLGHRLWLSPSCSLLHVPIDLEWETELDGEIKSWLAFAKQKLGEVSLLQQALNQGVEAVAAPLKWSRDICEHRKRSGKTHNNRVQERFNNIHDAMTQRNASFEARSALQQDWLKLPIYPTTTIGSFPQTADIRAIRRKFKKGEVQENTYREAMKGEIKKAINLQEELGLDVFVHGEPERNDMVEYFGELLEGFAFTQHGWVQSYGSRCVKPPIIYGDVSRPTPMTTAWIMYAQSLTQKPVKGMLTGPVTILNWSFVRDDQPRSDTCTQIALALRDEVNDLEKAGIRIIQVDEAALREGLPLRKEDWQDYLDWAVRSFRITVSGVQDSTQIHTHMCYSNFNDIITALAAMDADVITIETSRSDMALLDVFRSFDYPNAIGPGVYDIHSPNIPSIEHICSLISNAGERIPKERLWINPDCGLKTRSWKEVEAALTVMADAAKKLRADQELL